jgi:BirA family biotin operon repressor/biotin-[acetyl-CoA-carboxylase] ligase
VIYHYPSVDSTMRVAADLEIGDVVTADAQTAGQGRHGHSWYSEPGTGIYCSIVLEPRPLLTLALGLAAADAIAESTGIACDLRWPNDLMLDSLKVGGILVQLVEGKAIAGIGINVNHSVLPAELAATSLRIHAGRTFDRQKILDTLLPTVESFAAEDAGDRASTVHSGVKLRRGPPRDRPSTRWRDHRHYRGTRPRRLSDRT